jgi:jasmonate ZIM domain-containing protein
MMTAAAAAAAAVKSAEMKKAAAGSPASNTPVLTRSPSLQSTSSALPSPLAQLYPVHQGFSLCKLQSGKIGTEMQQVLNIFILFFFYVLVYIS